MAENEEKIFEYYLMLPKNVRSSVNDEMMPNDRCRLTRCSKQCSEEAKVSRNFIYQLDFFSLSDNHTTIGVQYGNCAQFHHVMSGYFLEFITDRYEKKRKRYCDRLYRTKWEIELGNSTNTLELAIGEFKFLLQRLQNSVRKIDLDDIMNNGGCLGNVDLGIESLNNLESLRISGHFDIRQIFAKLNRPLKDLTVIGEKNSAILADCEQTYQVQRSLVAWKVKLDEQQYSRLSAPNVGIHIGELTERDVFKLIRSWQNRTFHKKIEGLSWELKDSNFDIWKLSRLLRVGDNLADGTIAIKHFGNDGKRAFLSKLDETLYFATDD